VIFRFCLPAAGCLTVETTITCPPACLSGHWTGFANEGTPDNRRRLDLLLQLRDNRLSGVGDDDTGMFVLSGEFDPDEREFRWVQTYLFGDTLFCRGFCEDDRIWGTWQNATEGHGGFQIWPLAPTGPTVAA
jgi:hypothetical protein